jgi:hypothetical protein
MNLIKKIKSWFKKKPLKTTEWYGGNIKPVYVGYYEVRSKIFGIYLLKWDGQNWLYSDGTVAEFQGRDWRGIKK